MSAVFSRFLLLAVIKFRESESVSTSVVVSVAYAVFYGARLLALRPTLKPGGPGDHSLSGLYPLTCPAWVILPGVQDSRQHSSRRHGDTQAASPLQGDDPTEARN